ncbi:hypothetical protein YDYSY3_38770 [Paenibacillus chitinolyticus]|uniref:hypothetical protein n=1 Tax=Paenibacillus chitinolyticus TaxID=79263 RepID=UPI0026E4C2E9|nr:hypothetical protein [Paenibacillus chitinolyticus]GKS12877.1 hypothetical protein YDYSY3_38770 [Paenibacillus chitinolyticus]
MSLFINLEFFKKNLPEPEQPNRFRTGLFIAIEAAHNEIKSDEVNWDLFTLSEAELALDHAMGYVSADEMEESQYWGGSTNDMNAIHQYLHNMQTIGSLKKCIPANQTSIDIQFF